MQEYDGDKEDSDESEEASTTKEPPPPIPKETKPTPPKGEMRTRTRPDKGFISSVPILTRFKHRNVTCVGRRKNQS